MKSKNDQSKNNKNQQDECEDDKYKSKIISLHEYEDDDEESEISEIISDNKNSEDSDSESIDEERITLGQIEKITRKERNNNINIEGKSKFLNKKSFLNHEPIIYDEKKGKILESFCGTPEELNIFLVNCQPQKLSYEDFSPSFINNSNSISFDPNLWMQANKIKQRIINIEDLSIYCQNKIPKKNYIKNNFKNINIKKEKIKEEKNENIEIKDNINIEKIEKLKKLCSIDKKNIKLYKNYVELHKIISCKILSIEQKNWLNNLFNEINNIDIKDIIIEKDKNGKDNKLEIVFDLDNTCIFSFLSNSDVLLVQSKKNIFPQKEVKLISFHYNNKVLYSALIIRKGLKEFIKYIQPLCNFHISTLGAENYGKEILNILSDYFQIKFINYKGRLYDNELIKNISDLYIEKGKTIIFDDNIKAWDNGKGDYENVIISKYFFDEECVMINTIDKNIQNDPIYNIDLFLNSYRIFFYNKFKDNNNIDWKDQQFMEHPNVPFYQFKSNNDYNYNKCFTAEYLNSEKLQFIYMKNVVKQLYILRFIYDIDISLGIKLIRISILNNMKFDLKYLTFDQKAILTEIVRICGGIIYENNYKVNNERIYLVASKRLYNLKEKKEEIKNDLEKYPYYFLINEKFILDSYYFMTNLKDFINDPEYTFNEDE